MDIHKIIGNVKPQTTFKIEKVLRKQTTKEGKKELYVKRLGYSKDFNQ